MNHKSIKFLLNNILHAQNSDSPSFTNRCGMSLTELLVAVILVSILMSATFYVFSSFFATSLSSERRTMAQSDFQASADILKWDIFMSGYGMPSTTLPMSSNDNTTQNNSDSLTLRSMGFTMEGGTGRWTYMLSPSINSNQILVRKWPNATDNITKGDRVVILSATKARVGNAFYVVNETTSAVGPTGQAAYLLTLNGTVRSTANFVFATGNTTGNPFMATYTVRNGNLLRNGQIFIRDVVSFQVSYWIDRNGNRVQENGEIFDNLAVVQANPKLADNVLLMRLTVVTATRGEQTFVFPQDSMEVENSVLNFNNLGRNFRYDLWQNSARPRNL